MKRLDPPASHRVNAAIGWLELGDAASAEEEIQSLPAAIGEHPLVLEVKWRICAEQRRWEEAARLGNVLVKVAAYLESGWVHRSYALHELGRTREAKQRLEPAIKKFPDSGIIRYNLACYACRLGEMAEALSRVSEAAHLLGGKRLLHMAQADEDLKPLFNRIQEIV